MKNKSLMKYICFMIVCTLFGVAVGFGTSLISDCISTKSLEDMAALAGFYMIPIVTILSFALVVGLTITNYNKAKKSIDVWDGEEETIVDEAENNLNIALITSNTGFILNCILLSVFICAFLAVSDKALITKTAVNIGLAVGDLAFYLLSVFFNVVFQQKIMKLIQKINPEKQVNIYDSKFESKWFNSCDEAEQVMIYKSGYKAYKNTMKIVNILWILSIFGAVLFSINGWVPIVIGIIWMTMVISYQMEAYRLEKH